MAHRFKFELNRELHLQLLHTLKRLNEIEGDLTQNQKLIRELESATPGALGVTLEMTVIEIKALIAEIYEVNRHNGKEPTSGDLVEFFKGLVYK